MIYASRMPCRGTYSSRMPCRGKYSSRMPCIGKYWIPSHIYLLFQYNFKHMGTSNQKINRNPKILFRDGVFITNILKALILPHRP